MGWLNRLFSRKPSREPDIPRDFWSPKGVDRLLNEDVHEAIVAAATSPTVENRRNVFQLLLGIVYCIPTSGEAGDGNSQTITASMNDMGEKVLMVFTDPCALKRWAPDPPSFMVFPAAKLFEFVLANEFVQVVINVAGPVGGQLSRREVESLAQGASPVE